MTTCILSKKGDDRCKDPQPKLIDGVPHMFSEDSMLWEKVSSLSALPNPPRLLCLSCYNLMKAAAHVSKIGVKRPLEDSNPLSASSTLSGADETPAKDERPTKVVKKGSGSGSGKKGPVAPTAAAAAAAAAGAGAGSAPPASHSRPPAPLLPPISEVAPPVGGRSKRTVRQCVTCQGKDTSAWWAKVESDDEDGVSGGFMSYTSASCPQGTVYCDKCMTIKRKEMKGGGK